MQLGESCGALLKAAFDMVDEGLVVFDTSGTVVFANRSFKQIAGTALPDLADLLGESELSDLSLLGAGGRVSLCLRDGWQGWEARATSVVVEGRPAIVVALRRRSFERLPSLDDEGDGAEDSWHRISRSSLEAMALGRALEELPVGMALVESTRDGFGVVARNPAYSRMVSGSEPSGASAPRRGESFAPDQTTTVNPDQWPGAVAARTGTVIREQEIRMLAPDGTWRVLHASAAPVPSSDGSHRALEVVFDVTEGVRGQEVGALTQARYATVFASCNDCLLVAQYDAREETFTVREANDPLLLWLGKARDAVIGASLPSVLPPLENLKERLREVLTDGGASRAEVEVGGRHYLTRAVRVSSNEVAIAIVETTSIMLAEREVRGLAERHARTAETVPGVLYDYRVSDDGRILFEYVSPRASQVLGIEAQSLVERSDLLWSRIGTHERQTLFRDHRRSDGGVEDVSYVTPDLRNRYLRFSWASDAGGGIGRRGSGVVLDVTDSTLARSQLLRSRHELFELLAKLPLGVFVEREGRIVFANTVFASLSGRGTPIELLGVSVGELFGRAFGALEARLEGEAILVRSDGSSVELEVSARREVELEGQRSMLWTVRDLTELRAMRVRLAQADRLASVGMLAAGVAHEINNPLAYLIASLDFLRESQGSLASPAVVGALAEAWEGANRVRQVVRDLKAFSRPDVGRPTRVDLHGMLDSAGNMASHEIRSRARLTKHYGTLPPVLANESRLAQVFLNLIVNAAQAIRGASPGDNEVALRTGTDASGWAFVEIRDTGEGIPPAHLERVFEPFFSTKVERGGTGLGLAICKSTIDAMGGRIEVESRVGNGTLVRVSLPPAVLPGLSDCKSERAPVMPVGRRGKVLVVDDEPAIAMNLKRLLEREHDVVVHTDGGRALEVVAAGERFDLILCDLMMPEMSGMRLWERLGRLDPAVADSVVFLTGGAFTADAQAFLRTTSNACLEKPFDTGKLRALVRERVHRMKLAV